MKKYLALNPRPQKKVLALTHRVSKKHLALTTLENYIFVGLGYQLPIPVLTKSVREHSHGRAHSQAKMVVFPTTYWLCTLPLRDQIYSGS